MAAGPNSTVSVDVLGEVRVGTGEVVISGSALGGRRARVVLVALALSTRPAAPEALAELVWPEGLPATWPVALRGLVSGLRQALAPLSEGPLIETTGSGYRLADGAAVPARDASAMLARAENLLQQGRYDAVLASCGPLTELRGSQLLPQEDGEWVESNRYRLEADGVHALRLVAAARAARGDLDAAVSAARESVDRAPLDERNHRALIAALIRAGDRAGVVQAFERCRTIVAEELGVDPSKETIDLYLSALEGQATSPLAAVPGFTTSFVGRDEDLVELRGQLGEPGLVTVIGPGGVGKSRLAAESAGVRGGFAGLRSWVSLASLTEAALVGATVALSLGVAPGAEAVDQAIAVALAALGRTLLVLDGCDQVLDQTASLAEALLVVCPQLTVLSTARRPLGLDGERVVQLAPLAGPSDEAVTPDEPAVRLLLDRVRAAGGELDVDLADTESLALLAEVCRRCAGLPLALELAAAQLTAMPVGDLLDALPERSAWRDPLRGLARSSIAMLDPDEEAVFRRFAVLDGPVGLAFVRAVVSGDDLAPERVVRVLRELTARGLVSVDRSGVRWRYQQDDDLHALAAELLVQAGEEPATLTRMVDAVEALLPADPRSPPAPYAGSVSAVLGAVRGLLGAALDGRLAREHGLRIAFRLHRYWAATNVAEGRFWLDRLLDGAPASKEAALATYALGYLSYWAGDTADAVARLRQSVEALRGVEDVYVARALIYLAGLADDQDRGADAVEYVREAVSGAAQFDADLQVAAAIGMGCVLAERADPEAVRSAADAIDLCRARASVEQLTAALPTAAMVCWQVGDVEAARAYVDEAWPLHRGPARIARVVLLSAAAGVALADGDTAAAVDLAGRGDEEATALGVEREVPLVRCLRARALLSAGDLVGAAIHAAAAVEAARALAYAWPLALCLETAAVVAHAGEVEGALGDVPRLLAAADAIRTVGDRPGPPTLRPDVDRVRVQVGGPVDVALPGEAAELALTVLGLVRRRH